MNTAKELSACLDALRRRRGLSYEGMAAAAKKLQPKPGGRRLEALAKSTIGEIVTGKRMPSKQKLLSFLAVCQVAPADEPQWLAAWERASTADLSQPPGAMRARDARPRKLGVHAAIQSEHAQGELPAYVLRDLDAELRSTLTRGAEQGCFLLLLGGSSVGKTRTLYEAVLATMPDWWLVHPADPDEIRALAKTPTPRTVVWLDELQRYLDVDDGLAAGTVRTLLRAETVLVGTMWPDEYAARITLRKSLGDESGGRSPRARDHELLDLAHVIDVPAALTTAERRRAQGLAGADRRIQIALDTPDGVTQVLAAGPQLVRWWEQAQTPYGSALITAAIDARRLGTQGSLTRDLLADAVPDYLASASQATAPANWFEQAMDYATTRLHGATAALEPVSDGTMGGIAGYSIADFLVQYGRSVRNGVVPPDSLWSSAVAHIEDLADRTRLGWAAQHRCLNRYAALLFEPAADGGSAYAMRGLAHILLRAGDSEAAATWLRRAAELGATDARLVHELQACGLWSEAEALLSKAAHAGDPAATFEFSKFLEGRGRREEADTMLQQAVALGYPAAVSKAARRLELAGKPDEAAACLRTAIDADAMTSSYLRTQLAEIYDRGDRSDEAKAVLQEAATDGDPSAMRDLGKRLLRSEDSNEVASGLGWLQRAARAGHPWAMYDLATALREAGQTDEARRWLEQAAGFGDPNAIEELTVALPPEEAAERIKELAGRGDVLATTVLTEVLDESETEAWLLDAAEDGNTAAMEALIWRLKNAGRLSEAEGWLRRAVLAGQTGAVSDLVKLLEQTRRSEEASRLRRYGIEPDGRTAAPWR
ncbi:helix-turn-helix domain-containing protein [Micromonospora purpureochromogenes]|uniref:helix-turn-helix domain-containing protein n=1 Tax=Micromonospora purpureochromogenes TaxID=47872 RepID=UPI003325D4E4